MYFYLFFYANGKKPKCSNNILIPINIKIAPPANSAFDLYFVPNTFPILTPMADKINVTIAINDTAGIISTCKNANVTPTARASILVAIARITMFFNPS